MIFNSYVKLPEGSHGSCRVLSPKTHPQTTPPSLLLMEDGRCSSQRCHISLVKMIKLSGLLEFPTLYPLVMVICYIAIERYTIFNGRKSTISMVIFNSYVTNYQRVYQFIMFYHSQPKTYCEVRAFVPSLIIA